MALQAVGINLFLPAQFARNPVQMIGMLGITMLATNALSNLPMAQAKDASIAKACEIACAPLPGEKDDAPERICTETCKQGAEIIETKTKEVMKNGKWKAVEVLGKVATPIAGYFDCTSVCGPSSIFNEGGNLVTAGLQYVFGDKIAAQARAAMAAAKAGCTAMLAIPQIGYASCMSCCTAIKYFEIA